MEAQIADAVIFNIRFVGAIIWNLISEQTKKLKRSQLNVELKNGIFQQYINIDSY